MGKNNSGRHKGTHQPGANLIAESNDNEPARGNVTYQFKRKGIEVDLRLKTRLLEAQTKKTLMNERKQRDIVKRRGNFAKNSR